jgi:hypothetical protein
MSTTGWGRGPLGALRRVTRDRPAPVTAERCDMCATPVGEQHSHVVDLHTRTLMCACRPCYLLFTDDRAHLHYRAVPDRYRAFPGVDVWDELQIPVGLAFLFRNSVQDRTVAFYPGPAGATESELSMDAFRRIEPQLAEVRPDVEALLLRRDECYLVPIDVCYELAGLMRTHWRGFDGGAEAHAAVDTLFARVKARCR